jgi:hypothetical protein
VQAEYGSNAGTRAWVMNVLVRSWEYRRPRLFASLRVVAGSLTILVGAILCGTGFWWGALMMGLGALALVVAGLMFALVTTPGVTARV